MRLPVAAFLALLALTGSAFAGQTIPGGSVSPGPAGSVVGTAGQITVTPSGINSVVSLPATITQGETFSGAVNHTGGFAIGGSTLTLGGNTTLPAPPASTQCLHMSAAGAVTASGDDCSLLTQTLAVSAAGNTQGTATALTATRNIVSTVAQGAGVVLAAFSAIGANAVFVVNQGANQLTVYPPSGAAIDGLAANSPITVAIGSAVQVMASSATVFYTVP